MENACGNRRPQSTFAKMVTWIMFCRLSANLSTTISSAGPKMPITSFVKSPRISAKQSVLVPFANVAGIVLLTSNE